MEELNKENNPSKVINVSAILKICKKRRKLFYKLWLMVFLLSCLWIFPQPRYYDCEMKLAPEVAGEDLGGGLASIASSFGFNLGSLGGNDAIYPTLYPDLFDSPGFIVSLFDIQIETIDGEVKTSYYDYLKSHQKKNWLTQPFLIAKRWVSDLFPSAPDYGASKSGKPDSFQLSRKDFGIVTKIQDNVKCQNDKKTDVTTIVVRDQDPLVAARLCDSISARLQEFVILYRTKKTRVDQAYYQSLCDSAKIEYDQAARVYCNFVETHKGLTLKSYSHEEELLSDEVDMKKQTYVAMNAQLQAMKAKVQEKTPVFTVLKSPTVPIKPSGPKRVIFVVLMLFLSTLITVIWLSREEIHFTN